MATSPITKRILYSDLFTNMDVNPVSTDVALKTNENAIKQSIRNLLLTNRGERPFQPLLGGDLKKLLFENMSPQTFVNVKKYVETAIKLYEPRANLIDTIVDGDWDNNSVNITIVFNVINKQEPVSLQLIITRVR